MVIAVTFRARLFSWDALAGSSVTVCVGVALGSIHTSGPTLGVVARVGIATVGPAIDTGANSIAFVDGVHKAFDAGLCLADGLRGIELTCSISVTITIGATGGHGRFCAVSLNVRGDVGFGTFSCSVTHIA